MKIKTRLFEIGEGRYKNLTKLAEAMDISVGYLYKVRQGKRNINQKFIVGATKAFPGYNLDGLFYIE